MENEILCGDCYELLDSVPDNSCDALVTDPIFGIGYKYENKKENHNDPEKYWEWFKPIYEKALAKVKPGGFVAIWQSTRYFKHLWDWYGDDIHIYISCKNYVQFHKLKINYAYDPIVIFYKQGAKPLCPCIENDGLNRDYFVSNTAGIRTDKNALERGHPCPLPLDQVREIIKGFVIEEGIVLDPFCGSGTIPLVAYETGRKYIAMDKEKKYIELTKKRIKKEFVNKRSLPKDFKMKSLF